MKPRVYITGIGAVTPYGLGSEVLREGLLAGRSAIRPIVGFEAESLPVRFGGELQDLELEQHFDPRRLKTLGRLSAASVLAARLASDQAGLASAPSSDTAGVFYGSGFTTLPEAARVFMRYQDIGDLAVEPRTIPLHMPNAPPAHIAIDLGLRGPHLMVATACSSASNAIGQAFREIRDGRADMMLAGGGECALTRSMLLSWCRMRVLSTCNQEPERASRPFHQDRDGMVVSDAIVILVLESEARVRARGARPLAELSGFGMSCDASHLTQPCSSSQARAMRDGLADANMAAADIDYVSAHGTGTRVGDVSEVQALRDVLACEADRVSVSAVKSMVGHTLGASGAIGVAASVYAMETGRIPPTINLDAPDPECVLRHVSNVAETRPVRGAMVNSFGFGGSNAVLVLRSPFISRAEAA